MSQLLRRFGSKLIELFPVRNGGEFTNQFQVSDTHDGIPPEVGMFAVLHLSGSEILVRFRRQLPYKPGPLHGNINNLGVNDYRYVRPKLDATQVVVGKHVTLFVGPLHFLVEIDEILQSSKESSGIKCSRTVEITVTPPTPLPEALMMPGSPRLPVPPSPSHLSPTWLAPPPRTAPRSTVAPLPAETVSGPPTPIQLGSRRKKPELPPTPETSPEPRSFLSLSEHTIPQRSVPGSLSSPRSSSDAFSFDKDLPELPDTSSSHSSSSTSSESYFYIPPTRAPNPRRQAFIPQLLPASSRRPPDSSVITNSIITGPPVVPTSSAFPNPSSAWQRSSINDTPTGTGTPQTLNNSINTHASLRRHPSLRPRTTPFASFPLSNEIRSSNATSTQPNNTNTGMDALNFLTVAEAPTPTATVTGTPFDLPVSGNASRATSTSNSNSGSRGSRHSRSSSVAVPSTRTPSSSPSSGASASEKASNKRHSHNGSSSRASAPAPGPARPHEVIQHQSHSHSRTQSLNFDLPTSGVVLNLNLTLYPPIADSSSSNSPSTPTYRIAPSPSLCCRHYEKTAAYTHAQNPKTTATGSEPNSNVNAHVTRTARGSSSSRSHVSPAIASGSGSGAVATGWARNDHESRTRRDATSRRSHQPESKVQRTYTEH